MAANYYEHFLESFLHFLRVEKGLAERSCKAYKSDLEDFFNYFSPDGENREHRQDQLSQAQLNSNTVSGGIEKTNNEIVGYIADLFSLNRKGSSIQRKISAIKGFYRFLYLENYIKSNPTDLLEIPKRESHLPEVLTEEEVARLLELSREETSPQGVRDFTILLTLYSTGIRVTELVTLDIDDLSLENPYLKVMGKGDRERWVPVPTSCMKELLHYVDSSRPILQGKNLVCRALFLNKKGQRMSRQSVYYRVRNLTLSAGITKVVSPHTFRHTAATHMLHHGAQLRIIQEYLGHQSLATTQLYTHLSHKKLENDYRKFHPRSRKTREEVPEK